MRAEGESRDIHRGEEGSHDLLLLLLFIWGLISLHILLMGHPSYRATTSLQSLFTVGLDALWEGAMHMLYQDSQQSQTSTGV